MGGVLSPLLSNIVLHELDEELERRGHRFVRYADDCNIYVRSERAGLRVMASVRSFIERRLRLKVNTSKSAVARPEERHFVGFRLKREPMHGGVQVLLSKRTQERFGDKLRELTRRAFGNSMDKCIERLNSYLRGWLGHFRICTSKVESLFRDMDSHIRRRMRAIQLKHWKRRRTIVRKLIAHGIRPQTAWSAIYAGRTRTWRLSHLPVVDLALRNSYWEKRGLISLQKEWRKYRRSIAAPAQRSFAGIT